MTAEVSETKQPRITVRQMEIDDIPSVYRLGEDLFTSEEFPILYRTWDAYEVTGAFTSDPDYCFVAEAGGEVVGFLLGTTIEKEGTAWKKYGYVSWIGVDVRFQRKHLAWRLYRKLEQRLKATGVRMMMADTEEANQDAIAFFRSMGFAVRGEWVWLTKTLPRTPKRRIGQKRVLHGEEESSHPGG